MADSDKKHFVKREDIRVTTGEGSPESDSAAEVIESEVTVENEDDVAEFRVRTPAQKKAVLLIVSAAVLLALTVGIGFAAWSCSNTGEVTDVEMTLDMGAGDRTGLYTGTIKNGVPEGQGRFDTMNPSYVVYYYEGEWHNGQPNGTGITVWETGDKKVGEHKNGLLNGHGTYYLGSYNGGKVYEGEFVNDTYEGQGTLYDSDGNEIYSGTFSDGAVTEPEKFAAACNEIPYVELYNHPEQYMGKGVKYTGKIVKVTELWNDNNSVNCLVQLNDDQGHVISAYYYLGEGISRINKGDSVTFYGMSLGLVTDTGTDGSAITVPRIENFVVEWSDTASQEGA